MQQPATSFSLSTQQRRVWRLHQNGIPYIAQATINIAGPLDVLALKEAVQRLIERHEIFRTTFTLPSGTSLPVQVVHSIQFPIWRAVEPSETGDVDAQIAELATAQRRHRFELATGPLICAWVLAVSAGRHVLLLAMPSLCADTRTLINVACELEDQYGSAVARNIAHTNLIQYKDFAHWHNNVLSSPEAHQAQTFWEAFLNSQCSLSLPFHKQVSSASGASELSRLSVTTDTVLNRAIDKLRSEYRVSPAAIVLMSFELLIWRMTGCRQFLVWDARDDRDIDILSNSMGLFTTYLPLPCRIDSEDTFVQLAHAIEDSRRESGEWQTFYAPENLFLKSDGITSDGFRLGYEFNELTTPKEHAPVSFTLIDSYACNDQFDLRLVCDYHVSSIRITLHYDPAKVTAATISRLAVALQECLSYVAANFEHKVDTLPSCRINDDLESASLSPQQTIHELLQEQVERTPDRIAAVYEAEYLSYAALAACADTLAARLRETAVVHESFVGLCVGRSVEMIIGIVGILKAGAAYVALDPNWPTERVKHVLATAKLKVCVSTADPEVERQFSSLTIVRLAPELPSTEPISTGKPPTAATPRSPAYVIFTSGSTGAPKGVVIEHGSAVNLAIALQETIYNDTHSPLRLTINAPLSFDASVKQLIQLLYGHTLVVVTDDQRIDAHSMLAFVARQRINGLDCTPSQFKMLLRAGLGSSPQADYPDLQMVLAGGEAIDSRTWSVLSGIPGVRFFNLYGPTECTVDSTIAHIAAGVEPNIGRPLRNIDINLLDDELNPVPPGTPGQIHVAGDCLARGYLNRPDLTAAYFTANPFTSRPGTRLYRTGDLARLRRDGTIEYIGRVDDQVKIRGHRVETGEVNAALQCHPSIRDSAVVPYQNSDGITHLAAYVVPDLLQPAASTTALRTFLAARLPDYMIPAHFITLSRLPVTVHGKLDRASLPRPDQKRPMLDSTFSAPRTQLEGTIASLWAKILHIENIGTNDNFFDLGGDSLSLVQTYDFLKPMIAKQFSVIDLFKYPTVRLLADFLTRPTGNSTLDSATARAGTAKDGTTFQ